MNLSPTNGLSDFIRRGLDLKWVNCYNLRMNERVVIKIVQRRRQPRPVRDGDTITISITAIQHKAFVFIAERLDLMRPPSYKEIKKFMGYASWNAVQYTVWRLKESGLLESSRLESGRGEHRSLRLTEFGNAVWQSSKGIV